ncbi:hypothetical protein PoB_005979600 [Plakobranchus ocellatus]|uniref:Uncharacterized protein n=1 Tax=Plakobranchus ocellatus TaxID=259542 RepID=A0AAV4CK44_9GAST|nr:hypothetical protein PoB_005979600 [Plakobranchus ocellatus]
MHNYDDDDDNDDDNNNNDYDDDDDDDDDDNDDRNGNDYEQSEIMICFSEMSLDDLAVNMVHYDLEQTKICITHTVRRTNKDLALAAAVQCKDLIVC